MLLGLSIFANAAMQSILDANKLIFPKEDGFGMELNPTMTQIAAYFDRKGVALAFMSNKTVDISNVDAYVFDVLDILGANWVAQVRPKKYEGPYADKIWYRG